MTDQHILEEGECEEGEYIQPQQQFIQKHQRQQLQQQYNNNTKTQQYNVNANTNFHNNNRTQSQAQLSQSQQITNQLQQPSMKVNAVGAVSNASSQIQGKVFGKGGTSQFNNFQNAPQIAIPPANTQNHATQLSQINQNQPNRQTNTNSNAVISQQQGQVQQSSQQHQQRATTNNANWKNNQQNSSQNYNANNKFTNQRRNNEQNNNQNQARSFKFNKPGQTNNPQQSLNQMDSHHQQPVLQVKGDETVVMMVAEKPSIARSLAEALSGPNGFVLRKTEAKFVSVLEYLGEFQGKPAHFKVTSVTGHVYHTDFPDDFQDWRKVNPVKLFDAPTMKKETNPGNGLIEHLQKEAKGAHFLVLWLDNDKEGENICFEVMELCREFMVQDASILNNVYRAKFSSITKPDLQQAFHGLATGPNYNESISVDARQIIDLKIGVAFSRFQSTYLVKKYEELAQKKITYGPCQTPTLGFCVAKHEEIQSFIEQSFYIPQIRITGSLPGQPALNNVSYLMLQWTKGRTFDLNEAQAVRDEVAQGRQVTVSNVENKQQSRGRPEGLNTVLLLKLASAQMGLGPQEAMQVAEKLYLQGYITYPRTESTHYPAKFDFVGVLNCISQHPFFISYIDKMQQCGLEKPKLGKDAGDHPPITPTTKHIGQVAPMEAKMYEFVVRHFLATISPDAKFAKKIVTFKSVGPNQHEFSLKGTTLITEGFAEIANWVKIHVNKPNEFIPDYQIGQTILVTNDMLDLHEGHTTAPEHLTESDLINLMEKNKIGTDASMATHIHNICEREYVTVQSNMRRLVPTHLGVALVRSYKAIDNELVDPELRSKIEQSVELIAQGEVDFDEVLSEVLELFKCKYINFMQNIQLMDQFFRPAFQTIEMAAYLHPECQFTLCPFCNNNSPPQALKDKLRKPLCAICSQAKCAYVPNQTIGNCLQCNNGNFLVLDHPMRQQYTCSCLTCLVKYVVIDKALQCERTLNMCDVCEAFLLRITPLQKALGQPLPDMMVCIYCDPGFRKDPNQKRNTGDASSHGNGKRGGGSNGNARQRGGRGGGSMRGGGKQNFNGGNRQFQQNGKENSNRFGNRNGFNSNKNNNYHNGNNDMNQNNNFQQGGQEQNENAKAQMTTPSINTLFKVQKKIIAKNTPLQLNNV